MQSLLHSYLPSSLPSGRPSALTEPVRLGPDNPHPLCGRKTELVWDGKKERSRWGGHVLALIAGGAAVWATQALGWL